ncbi:hypothetical protein NPIL_522921 [Nephila pilipes]|uniref:Uncharacterized protein n=1 Tax=Nephila pilipes TaxID=299642 RepID=A0A8X6U662_NEPPI|nr:hypothetical protein NPIL_522921 [Nephila pilipes]
MCPINPLNRPKKEDKKKQATEERMKLRNTLKEKRDNRTGASTARLRQPHRTNVLRGSRQDPSRYDVTYSSTSKHQRYLRPAKRP